MRALHGGTAKLSPTTVEHLDLCLGCRACESACPSGVHYGELLEATREFIGRNHSRGLVESLVRDLFIGRVFPHPNRLRHALLPARLLLAMGADRWLPRRLRELLDMLPRAASGAGLPPGAREPLPLISAAKGSRRQGRVGLVTGCVMEVLFESTHRNTIRVLNAAGYDVVLPAGQGCCGALHAHAGRLDAARQAAQRNIRAFEQAGPFDAIVVNSAGCGAMLKDYGLLVSENHGLSGQAAAFAGTVRDLTEILAATDGFLEQVEIAARRRGAKLPGRVTCHDACHLFHAQQISQPPRQILRAAAPDQFIELGESDVCCGSAGSYNLTEPDMARRLQERKIRHVRALGPVTVVTTNPGCLLQIQAGLRTAGLADSRVMHIADWLAMFLNEDGNFIP
jgi:glycolate oxidase iron-sulfur subunit